nr:phage major capsid protein [Myxococcus sp. AB036A]
MEKAINQAVTIEVASQLAARPTPSQGHTPITGKDMQFDLSGPTRQKMMYARLGLRMKKEYLARAKAVHAHTSPSFQGLDSFLERTKSIGHFASVFDQGGVFTAETVSTELVELTRPNSILLRAGVRTISGYGARLRMGTLDEGVTVYWVAEGEPPPMSGMKTGALVLTAHKLMGLAKISNDLLRLGTVDAAAIIGQDMAAALALEIDTTGLKGVGPKRPNGVRSQMADSQRTPTAGTTTTQKIDDVDGLMQAVEKAHIPGGLTANNGFYYSSTDTYYSLRRLRDSAGWLFPEMRDAQNPTLNGFPFLRTEALAGDEVFGFGLASQFIFGEALPLELAMGEAGNDFNADMVTMRGITEVDWLLRYSKAFAEKTDVKY